MNEKSKVLEAAIAIVLGLGLVFNLVMVFTVNYYWILLALLPNAAAAIVLSYTIFKDNLPHEDEFLIGSVILLTSPFFPVMMYVGYAKRTSWYKNCVSRGYFLPTKDNKKLHVVRKLKGL